MKKILLILSMFLIIMSCAGCEEANVSSNPDEQPSSSNQTSETEKKLLAENENVKIFAEGLLTKEELLGVGEGLKLYVENKRDNSIILSVSEVSVNGTMKTVVQPQMPANITSAGANSTQVVTFPDAQLDGAEIKLIIHISDEDYHEIFHTEMVTINF